MDKLNIILDLDECCIHSILYSDIKHINQNNFKKYKKKLKQLDIIVDVFKYKFDNKKRTEYSMTFRRPHLKQFITYLFKQYNVSVWSLGYYTYVDAVCNLIFTKSQKKQLKYIIGASYIDASEIGVYDIQNKKHLYNFETTNGCKDLNYLFENKPYSNLFHKENTILIDNDKSHLRFNKNKNMINVKDWYFNDTNDNILLNILEYFKSKKVNVSKLKHFLRQKKSKKK